MSGRSLGRWGSSGLAVSLALAAAFSGASCGHSSNGDDPAPAAPSAPSVPESLKPFMECQGSDQAFVKRALLAINGRRAWGQAEVNAYEDVLRGLREAGDPDARRVIGQVMMQEPAYRVRWVNFLMDSLHIIRSTVERDSKYDFRQAKNCFGPVAPDEDDRLAAWVRDNSPSATNPPFPYFRLNQLLSSSLALDDLSPVYRAHLFEMLIFPLPGANVSPLELERARRLDFGKTFQSVFIHRDPTCLGCHNSERSVTYSDDPATNRAWPVPGLFEKALFGSSSADGDPLKYASVFRHVDVADGGGDAPWGWDGERCGTFKVPVTIDPLGVDAMFGDSVGNGASDPQLASVWRLEPSLHRGVDLLATEGLKRDAAGDIVNQDAAFAYLTGANVVEQVWREMMGTPLTIPNFFPRTEVQRDTLEGLTDNFVRHHFSLKTVVLDVVTHPSFNLKAPEEGCGQGAYDLPRLFNPWTNAESDPALRGNALGDGVFPLSPRVMRRSLHGAMGWPELIEFPGADEEPVQSGLGFFLSNLEQGFRGLDLQANLVWESLYGACKNPGQGDYLSDLAARAKQRPGSTVGDAVVALKDRLVNEPSIEQSSERPELEALIGTSLDSTELSSVEDQLRLACGAYVASPQFLLGGMPPPDTREVPALTPDEHSYQATCATIAQAIDALKLPYAVSCSGTASVSKR